MSTKTDAQRLIGALERVPGHLVSVLASEARVCLGDVPDLVAAVMGRLDDEELVETLLEGNDGLYWSMRLMGKLSQRDRYLLGKEAFVGLESRDDRLRELTGDLSDTLWFFDYKEPNKWDTNCVLADRESPVRLIEADVLRKVKDILGDDQEELKLLIADALND